MNPLLLGASLNPYVSPLGFATLFTRIGHILYTIDTSINAVRGTAVPARIDTIVADFASSDQALADNLYGNLLGWQNASGGFLSQLRALAQSTVIEMVNDVAPQANLQLGTALAYLVDQMADAGQTVQRCAVASSVIPGPANIGDAVVVCGLETALGVPVENAFAETIEATVTADAITGGRSSGQETVQFRGQYAVSDPLSWQYPAGSACSATVSAVSAAANQVGDLANWLNNGSFDGTWTGDTPAQWTVDVGTSGTTIRRETSQTFDGANSLRFVGDGSELTSLYQTLGSAGGTTVAAVPLDQLAVNLWVSTAGAPASGVLEIALTDGTGQALTDAAGNPASFSKSLVGLGANWTAVNGVVRTPRVLPTTVRLRVRLSTALPAGASVYLDRLAMARLTTLYPQGPRVAIFSGREPLIAGDSYSLTISNDHGGGLQGGFDRLFGMRSLGLLLPSTSGTPTISDSLIA